MEERVLNLVLSSPHWAVHTEQSTLSSPHWRVHTEQSTLNSPHWAVHIEQSTLSSPQWAVHIEQSTLSSPHWAVHKCSTLLFLLFSFLEVIKKQNIVFNVQRTSVSVCQHTSVSVSVPDYPLGRVGNCLWAPRLLGAPWDRDERIFLLTYLLLRIEAHSGITVLLHMTFYTYKRTFYVLALVG